MARNLSGPQFRYNTPDTLHPAYTANAPDPVTTGRFERKMMAELDELDEREQFERDYGSRQNPRKATRIA